MTLSDVTSGSSTVSLTVSRDSSGIEDSVNAFVDSYNEFIGEYNELTAYDNSSGESGLLLGDATLGNIANLLRTNVGTVVDGVSSGVRALSDIGILANVDGTLGLNSTKLASALKDNLDGVGVMFAPIGVPSDASVTFLSSNSLTKQGSYAIAITQAATQGTLSGAGVLPATFGSVDIDANNDDFLVRIDGVASANLSLTQATYTSGASLAAEIQSKINSDSNISDAGLSVSVVYNDTDDRFDITSSTYGTGSTIAFSSVDTNTAAILGFSVAGGTAGLNVEGTINGVAGIGVGRELVSTSGDTTGLKLLISATTVGSLGSVVFTQGKATELGNILSGILDKGGILPEQSLGFSKTLTRAADDLVTLDYRMEIFEARLLAQFNVMDSLVSSLQATSSYLTQALDNLPGTVKKN